MQICVLLARLTGWSRTQILHLSLPEALEWLDQAIEVDKMLRR